MRMKPCVLNMLGDFSLKVGAKDDAEHWYKKAILTEPSFRDGYMKLAQLLAYQPRPDEALKVLSDMCEHSRYQEDWRLTTYYWRNWKVSQIVADALCWKGEYETAHKKILEGLADIKTGDDMIDATGKDFTKT